MSAILQTNPSLKLFLEGEDSKSNSLSRNLNLSNNNSEDSPVKPVQEIFGKLRFQQIPLDMLHCSEVVEGISCHNMAMSTPHPQWQRRAQFWSLSNATGAGNETFSIIEGERSNISKDSANQGAILQNMLDIMEYSNGKWEEASEVLKDVSSTREYQTAIQVNTAEGSSTNTFSGFDGHEETDENIKGREMYRKLVSFAEDCKSKYKELKESGKIDILITSISSIDDDITKAEGRSRSHSVGSYRRVTRSTGAPLELPYIQPKTLERKKKS